MSHLDLIRTPKVDNVKLLYNFNNKGARGTLHLTTTHLIFVNTTEGKETWILYGHIAEAEKLPLSARGSSILLKTTTFLNVTLIITRERDCNDVYDTIVQLSHPIKYDDLYAFNYSPKEEDLPKNSGWNVYNALAEFNRMEVPIELWVASSMNENYKLCETYPRQIFLPASASSAVVFGCAHFRSKNRLPVLSYFHKATKAAISRCAQPLAGLNSRCNEDEVMIQSMIKSNPNSNRMYIVDTRPKINAMANRAAGKGYENMDHYDNVDYQFIGIENIHAMRSSLKRMVEVFETKDLNMTSYLQGLNDSGWLKHIKSVMDTSCFISKAISFEKRSVVVHCSDGWDRTAQTCSIAGLLLDPYYRTIHGFQMLVEKEWLAFGHKFTDRCGMLSGDVKETSPIFTQFLESVWQLTNQYPTAFQFNEQFLLEIHNHLYSHQFGTFIGNFEKERLLLQLSERTYSLWGFMWQHLNDFINPFYETTHNILTPLTSQKNFKTWRGLYCKHSADIHPRESVSNTMTALKDNNTSLICHVRYLEERIEQLKRFNNNSTNHNLAKNKLNANKSLVVNTNDNLTVIDSLSSDCEVIDVNNSHELDEEKKLELKMACLDMSDDKTGNENGEEDVADGFEKVESILVNNDSGNLISENECLDKRKSDKSSNVLDTSGDGFEKLESVSNLVMDIPSFVVEWESLLTSSTCFCGKYLDSLSCVSHCWKCGRKTCASCVNKSARIPGHYSEAEYPVCKMCFKEINK